jgi:hypothetical protein
MAGELWERGELADAADLARTVFDLATVVDLPRIKPRRFSALPSAPAFLAGLISITWSWRCGARSSIRADVATSHAPGGLGDQPGSALGSNGNEGSCRMRRPGFDSRFPDKRRGRHPSIRCVRARLRAEPARIRGGVCGVWADAELQRHRAW